MSNSESRTEVVKPFLIKAAVPVALSATAYICAKLIWNRSDPQQNLLQPEEESFDRLDSASVECPESQDQDGIRLEDGLKSNSSQDKLPELEVQIEELQKREWNSEARFCRYQSLKEREFMLTEMKNLMILEKTRAESLLREIALMEEENRRMGDLLIDYAKIMQKHESLKRENGLLKMKARKHWRIPKQRLRILKRQKMIIEAMDAELLRNPEELESRDNLIHELEDQVTQLKEVVDHLQREKIQLLNKPKDADQMPSDSSNLENGAGVAKKEYEKVLNELEQIQKDRAEEAKELTYMKWSNACLRQELLKYHQQPDSGKSITKLAQLLEIEGNGEFRINGESQDCNCGLPGDDQDKHCLPTSFGESTITNCHVHSRRRRIVQKLKRWVEGGKCEDKEKSETRCFGTHSIPQEFDDQFVHARNSCSSV